MSTSTPDGACTVVSLRSLLREAVFIGASDIRVQRCTHRAEQCQVGDIYVPLTQSMQDGHDEVDIAVKRGAAAVVAERLMPVTVPQCLVKDSRHAYGQICQALAGNPSHRMLTIGVVGTHGKTTTGLYIAAMMKRISGQVAYYTSLGSSDSTTCDRSAVRPPATRRIAQWLKSADEAGSPAAVLELTPSMLAQRAISGIDFDLLVVTGLRPSQMLGAPNARSLRSQMSTLTEQMKSHGMILYNADDACASQWANAAMLPAIGYGLDASHHVRAKRLSRAGAQQQLLAVAGNMIMPLTLNTPGDHIARAALAGVAAGWMFDFPLGEAVSGVEALQSIPGRMQRVPQSVDVPIFIDAGQTPDRIAVALHALRSHQMGPITAVVDVSDRLHPQWRGRLGEVLDRSASKVVLSGISCRDANRQSILMDVLGGFRSPGRVQVIPNRDAAIRWAVNHVQEGSILLSGLGAMPWLGEQDELQSDEMVAKDALDSKSKSPVVSLFSVYPRDLTF